MDNEASDSKYILISENSFENTVGVTGYNGTLTAEAGVYNIQFPKTVTPGTYNLVTSTGFDASVVTGNQTIYNVTSGTLTVT